MSPRFPTAVNSCVAKGRFNPPQPPPLCLPRGHGRSDVESLRETSPCLQTLSLQEFWCQTQSAPPVFPPSFHRLLLLLFSCSVASDSLWSQGLWPTRLLCPWDFPGKNARVVAASSWDLPDPGIDPMSPAMALRFFATEQQGKPPFHRCPCTKPPPHGFPYPQDNLTLRHHSLTAFQAYPEATAKSLEKVLWLCL